MPETDLKTYSYWVVRYTPNLIRDEWLNIGVLLLDSGGRRLECRFLEEDAEFGRVRRLHPNSDEVVLRGLARHFQSVAGGAEDPGAYLAKLGETLSNVIALSSEHGVLAANFDEELDRLYQQHVAPPRRPGALGRFVENSRAWILGRVNDAFRAAGLAGQLERRVPVGDYTYQGDPLRLDYAYRRNGTRGFLHALSLERDAGQTKALAYTAERIRRRLPSIEFTVVTEKAPQPENDRHRFVAEMFRDQGIGWVSLPQLDPWVETLRSRLLQ